MPSALAVEPVFFPLDEELGLLPGALSPTLAAGVTRLASWMPFARATEQVTFFWGVRLSDATVRRQTEAAGAAYVAVQTAAVARLERDAPPAPPGPAMQQLSADGAMVPLVNGVWAEVKTLAIGTVSPPEGRDAPAAPHATDLSYFSRLADAATFSRLAQVETHRRGVVRAGTVVAVTDGSAWLQGVVDDQRRDAVRILDFPHAVGHLATAGQATLGAGTPAMAAWLSAQAYTLTQGDPADVLAALQALPTATAPDPLAAAAARDATHGYLTARWPMIQYATFRAAGYPIGSGAVESANKLVVEVRLKGGGMHWARRHVDPMVALRTVACADRWDEAWPDLVAHRRACRAARPSRRRTPATAPPPAPPSVPPPRRRPHAPAISAPPPLRSGRLHPWRRPFSTAQRIRQAAHAKL